MLPGKEWKNELVHQNLCTKGIGILCIGMYFQAIPNIITKSPCYMNAMCIVHWTHNVLHSEQLSSCVYCNFRTRLRDWTPPISFYSLNVVNLVRVQREGQRSRFFCTMSSNSFVQLSCQSSLNCKQHHRTQTDNYGQLLISVGLCFVLLFLMHDTPNNVNKNLHI
jgi:hypothetical protein